MNKERLTFLLLKGLWFILEEMQQASQVILRSYERLSHVYEESKGKSNKTKKEATGEREIFIPHSESYQDDFSNSGLNAHTLFRGDLPSPWLSWGFLQLEELVLFLRAPRASWADHRVSQLHPGPCGLVVACPACLFR